MITRPCYSLASPSLHSHSTYSSSPLHPPHGYAPDNLFFNLVRETSDHGSINTWDREPYLQTWKTGARTPAPTYIRGNFLINTHFGIHPIDHDDGSNAFYDYGNVVAFAGMKNFLGFDKHTDGNLFVRPDIAGATWTSNYRPTVPMPRAYYFPYCARSVGQKRWGGLADTFRNNTCAMNYSVSLYKFGSCDPHAPGRSGEVPAASGNIFYTPGGHAAFVCDKKNLTLSAAQKAGYDLGSTAADSGGVSTEDIQRMIRERLGGF